MVVEEVLQGLGTVACDNYLIEDVVPLQRPDRERLVIWVVFDQ